MRRKELYTARNSVFKKPLQVLASSRLATTHNIAISPGVFFGASNSFPPSVSPASNADPSAMLRMVLPRIDLET